jgi:hypothetical protein
MVLTVAQHRTLKNLLDTLPVNSVSRILYALNPSDDRVRLTLAEYNSRGEATGNTRTVHIHPDGTITEKQDVEVEL